MTSCRPEILVLTRDLSLAHAVTLAVPEAWTEWQQTSSAALSAIGPDTRVLIVDDSPEDPFARLLAAQFVDRSPGRRAVIVQRAGRPAIQSADPCITWLAWPATLDACDHAFAGWSSLESVLAAAA